MSAAIQREFPDASVELIGGGRGDFIVTAGDTEIWNKKKAGDFPADQQVAEQVIDRLRAHTG